MIGFVNGILRYKFDGLAIVECGGVGYEVFVTNSAYCNLPNVDEQVQLHTWMLVREDEMALFGFESMEEKSLFLNLISVSGIGARTALQILSGVKQKDLVNAICSEDTNLISKIKGIGKKTAERIILELRENISNLDLPEETSTKKSATTQPSKETDDAVIALLSLGFTRSESEKAVKSARESGADTIESIITLALQSIK